MKRFRKIRIEYLYLLRFHERLQFLAHYKYSEIVYIWIGLVSYLLLTDSLSLKIKEKVTFYAKLSYL